MIEIIQRAHTVWEKDKDGNIYRWREPSIGKCSCGELIALGGFTNTCQGCGREYNWAGQELAPRQEWGDETGENPADIGRIV
jgi:hypothetical protein